MRRAADGDREAFEAIYLRFAAAVHGILVSRLGLDEADDAVQEVFLQAWSRLSELREPSAFPGWICTIARRRAVDVHRRTQRHEELPAGIEARDRSEARAEALEALRAIQEMPEAYRETLSLRLVEGLSGPEIARATGLTHDSVRVNLSRGMKMLRERLGDSA